MRAMRAAIALGLMGAAGAVSMARPSTVVAPGVAAPPAPTGAGPFHAASNCWAPVIEHQLEVMEALRGVGLREVPVAPHLAAADCAGERPVRLRTRVFKGAGFRKVRLTSVDGGKGLQVFNSVWYPDESRDAPILGIDLLRFGPKNFLAICDLQPLDKSEAYMERYTRGAAAIRAKYPDLCGERSQRYYEDDRFFSDEMLYGRLADEGAVKETMLPAFQEYLEYYVDKVSGAAATEPELDVLKRHVEYDAWNAERDPAHALFQKSFGNEWAEEYLHEVLFELASQAPKEAPKEA